MKFFKASLSLFLLFLFLVPSSALAATTNPDVTNFANKTLSTLLIVATAAATLFLIKGGYGYITSTGKPDSLDHAKLTIRNALIGLVIVIGAAVFSSMLQGAFNPPVQSSNQAQIQLSNIEPAKPTDGLTQVLLDAVGGFLQNIAQSAVKPLTDGIITFVTTTPSIIGNSVIFKFWLIILAITDSLFVLVIALLGFHFMSASTFGFEEIEFKHLLPRIGLAFLGANTSIFLADWIVLSCNTLVQALLNVTGGLQNAWIINTAIDPATIGLGGMALITLIFIILFVILSIVLLLFYITRLITIAFGAAISPLIFLLWAVPKFADTAEIAVKSYLVAVYSVFVHVVIIQLASSFLTIPGQSGTNSLISILIGIGLLVTLLKTSSILMQFIFYNTGKLVIKKIGGQIMNVISSSSKEAETKKKLADPDKSKTTERRVVAA